MAHAHVQAVEVFSYRTLAPQQIRLLHLDADTKGRPFGRLEHVPMRKGIFRKKCNAMSYSWGSDLQMEHLLCDGKLLPVRKTLAQALSRLAVTSWRKCLWIDAICINQSDAEEKLDQIQLMPKIFSEAHTVLVWLGEETSFTPSVNQHMVASLRLLKKTKTVLTGSQCESKLPRDILLRSWYGRLWTLQEAVLARKIVMIAGSRTISWSLLEKLCKEIKRVGPDASTDDIDVADTRIFAALTAVLNIKACKNTQDTNFLCDLVRICRQRDCYDPKDRVYGILGLLPRSLHGAISQNLRPGDTMADTYISFAVALLRADAFLQGLSMIETTFRDPSLPSWCPDFHQRSEMSTLAYHYKPGHGYKAGFKVHQINPPSWSPDHPTELVLKGHIVDVVRSVVSGQYVDTNSHAGNDFFHYNKLEKLNSQWVASCLAAASDIRHDKQGYASCAEEAMYRFLFTNPNYGVHTKDRADTMNAMCAPWKKRSVKYGGDRIKLLDSFTETVLRDRKSKKNCEGRRFCMTRNTRSCLAPLTVQRGDFICLIKSARVPFLIRPAQRQVNKFILLGEAYVNGIMYGEALGKEESWEDITFI